MGVRSTLMVCLLFRYRNFRYRNRPKPHLLPRVTRSFGLDRLFKSWFQARVKSQTSGEVFFRFAVLSETQPRQPATGIRHGDLRRQFNGARKVLDGAVPSVQFIPDTATLMISIRQTGTQGNRLSEVGKGAVHISRVVP